MALWAKLGLSGPAAAAGGGLVALLCVGGYLAYVSMPESDAPSEAVAVLAPETLAEPEAKPIIERTPEAEVEVEDVAVVPEPEATPEPELKPEVVAEPSKVEAPEPDAPAFDVVQVEPDGGGILAGRSVPDRPVIFYLDGLEFARATADARGKFGLVLDFPVSDAPRALSMASLLEDGSEIASDGTLLISPVRAPEPKVQPEPEQVASVVPEPEPEPTPEPTPALEIADAEPEVVAEEPQPEVAEAPELDAPAIEVPTQPVEVATAEPKAEAPAVVLATNQGVTVLQPAPRPEAPNFDDSPVVANVVIDTITYDSSGDVALAGRGASDGFVRVYLNDKPIKTTQIAEDGSWRAPLPDVDAGVYNLRVDEVDGAGAVTSRVETPFQREQPDVVAASAPEGPLAITVQPGFTLWAIARDKFGAGEQYVRVYEANRDLIRDPDLIYPGQVFALPEG